MGSPSPEIASSRPNADGFLPVEGDRLADAGPMQIAPSIPAEVAIAPVKVPDASPTAQSPSTPRGRSAWDAK